MAQDNRKELYNLSNHMVDLFIKDIFSKNEIDMEKAKSKISEEQRESMKRSVEQLKAQVESFLYEKNTKKTITEDEETIQESPLREMFFNKKKSADNEEKE